MSQSTGFSPETDDPTVRLIAGLPKARGYPVIGQYILCSQLGAGGAGAVFMGYHVKLQRQVAIKVLNPAVLNLSDKAIARFEREAILTSSMKSNYIIPVTDAGTVPNTDIHYLVMDLIDGENAEDRVVRRGGMLSVSEALTIIRDATRGLADAHRQETIHRDLKPANIMVSAQGDVLLADLGIATSFEKPNLMYTQADEFLGTPQYMSPEQIKGDVLDGRTDVYSMGVTLHHLLTGEHPFHGSTAYAVMQRVENESLPDIRDYRDDVPANVANFIQAATQRDREERMPSSEAMASRLDVLLRKHGEANLADPQAGGEHRDRCIHIPSEDLQDIHAVMTEEAAVDRTVQSAPVKKRGKGGAVLTSLLLLMLLGGGAAAGAYFYLEWKRGQDVVIELTNLQRLEAAIAAEDVPGIAELMDEFAQLPSDQAQNELFNVTAKWLTSSDVSEPITPSQFLKDHPEDAPRILSRLNNDEVDDYGPWVKAEAQARIGAEDQDWASLKTLLVELDKIKALPVGLPKEIAPLVYGRITGQMRTSGFSAVSEDALDLLKDLQSHGDENFEKLIQLVEINDALDPSFETLEKLIELGGQLKMDDLVLDRVVRQATDRLEQEDADHARAITLLDKIANDSPGQTRQAVLDAFLAYSQRGIAAKDWGQALVGLDAVRGLESEGGTIQTQLANDAIAAIGDAVLYDPTGTAHVPGRNPQALLDRLIEMSTPEAYRWRVELYATWYKRGHEFVDQDVMTFREPIANPDFISKLGKARELSKGSDVAARLIFISYDRARYIVALARPLTADEYVGLFDDCFRGISSKGPDMAARYLSDCHFQATAGGEASVEDFDIWGNRMEQRLANRGIQRPKWNELEGVLSAAPGMNAADRLVPPSYWMRWGLRLIGPLADRRAPERFIHRRAQFWLAWGKVYMDPDGYFRRGDDDLLRSQFARDPASVRAVFENMLVAAEWGYAPRKCVRIIEQTLRLVNGDLGGGQSVLTREQSRRLDRLRKDYPWLD
ncbi:MAG: serine/threonine-protein kinase [Planctomycetota bacterium]